MIVALQRLPVAGAFEDDFASAMAAYVGERAKRAVAGSRDYDGNVAEAGREKIAGAAYLSGVSDVLPGAMEDAFFLGAEYFGIDVPVSGEGYRRDRERSRVRGRSMDLMAWLFRV